MTGGVLPPPSEPECRAPRPSCDAVCANAMLPLNTVSAMITAGLCLTFTLQPLNLLYSRPRKIACCLNMNLKKMSGERLWRMRRDSQWLDARLIPPPAGDEGVELQMFCDAE